MTHVESSPADESPLSALAGFAVEPLAGHGENPSQRTVGFSKESNRPESTNNDPNPRQENDSCDSARTEPANLSISISIEELRTNPNLAYRVLLGLFREMILDDKARLVLLRDLAEALRVYGPVEPMYSMEAAARLIPCSYNALKQNLVRLKDKLKAPHYALKKDKDQKWRKKMRYLYASDVLYLREHVRFKRAGSGSVSRYFAERRARIAGRSSQ